MDEPLGVNPIQGVVADAELAGVVADDAADRPSASIAPNSAASLATRTGLGVTFKLARPRARKWSIHPHASERRAKRGRRARR